jgi:hypothetical protein
MLNFSSFVINTEQNFIYLLSNKLKNLILDSQKIMGMDL